LEKKSPKCVTSSFCHGVNDISALRGRYTQ